MRPVNGYSSRLTLLALAVGLAACGSLETHGPAEPPEGPTRELETAEVVRLEVLAEEPVPGVVQARNRATLAARVAASVTGLPYDEGQWVPAGAVVARLDDAAVRSMLGAAADAATAAEADLDRTRALLGKGAATPRELEQMVAAASGARAHLAAARDGLSYTVLRAPFAGRVAARHVSIGDVVSPGAPLIEIEAEGGLEVRTTVEPAVAANLRPGAKLKALVDGQPEPLPVVVTAVAPSGDPTTHRFALQADLPIAPGLRAGLFARLLVPGVTAEARLTVPATALFERGGLTGLFVAHEGQARLRWVAVGTRDGDTVEVRAGVEAGERVFVDPAGLADGSKIREAR